MIMAAISMIGFLLLAWAVGGYNDAIAKIAMIDIAAIEAAARRLDGVAIRTPLIRNDELDRIAAGRVLVKAENLQAIGSFKIRGVLNKLASLSDEEKARGVVAMSSGNHAQAVAYGARLGGVPAVVVMPTYAVQYKIDATRALGAEVVLVEQAAGSKPGEVSGADLDLVEIVPNAEPPVCRIMNYGKYVFELKKQKQEARKKQKTVEVKEIKMRPNIDDHDYNVKMKSMERFFGEGDKVKVTLRFRGREMAHQDLGRNMLERVADDVKELGKVENMPKMEGRQMVMMIGPSK